MEYNPDHDYDHPDSGLNAAKMIVLMHNHDAHPLCTHCHERRQLTAMHGTAWGWESSHEHHCPQHDDNQEPVVSRVVDHWGGPEHLEAEAIWLATQDDAS